MKKLDKIKDALELRLTELEVKEETIDNLMRRLELIKTLLTINEIEQDYDIY